MTPSERRRIYYQPHNGMLRSCGLEPISPGQHKSAQVFAWASIAMLVWCAAWVLVEAVRWLLNQTVFI